MNVENLKFAFLTIGLVLVVSGCAHAPSNSGYTNFSSYAESVFRHQNEVNSRLFMLSEADLLPDNEEFDKAEDAFREACQLLNEYAEREAGGESLGLGFQNQVQNSVETCDAKTVKMQEVLKRYGLENY